MTHYAFEASLSKQRNRTKDTDRSSKVGLMSRSSSTGTRRCPRSNVSCTCRRAGRASSSAMSRSSDRTSRLPKRRQSSRRINVPYTSSHIRASWRRKGGSIRRQTRSSRRSRRPSRFQVGEVWCNRCRCTTTSEAFSTDCSGGIDGTVADETVVVCLLDPFVDDCAGPDVLHWGGEDGGLVAKGSWFGSVAAGFRQEDWDRVVGCVDGQLVVAGDGVGALAAPFVGVESCSPLVSSILLNLLCVSTNRKSQC